MRFQIVDNTGAPESNGRPPPQAAPEPCQALGTSAHRSGFSKLRRTIGNPCRARPSTYGTTCDAPKGSMAPS